MIIFDQGGGIMLDSDKIKMNFQKAIKDAEDLENLAARLDSVANVMMEDSLDRTRGAWKGTNADLFIGKTRQIQEDVKAMADKVRREANGVRTKAQEIYDTEMRNYEIAMKRIADIKNAVRSVISKPER